jgi:hypothetical protein
VDIDLNRGHDKSLSYNMDPKTGEWKAEFVRYRYKRDTELVIGCGGRHKIIESPKAGRYAQLWCRTCCNCSLSSKAIGNLVGCTNTAHWHTVTNRSYHEKTPFHQLAHNLLLASYAEALQAGIPFEDAIGLTGQTYYKMSADKGGDLNEQPGGGAPRREVKGVDGAQAIRSLKRERGVKDVHLMMHEGATAHAPAPQGLNGVDAQLLRDPQLLRGPDLRGVNGLNGMMGISSSSSQSQLHQVFTLSFSSLSLLFSSLSRPVSSLSRIVSTCRRLQNSRRTQDFFSSHVADGELIHMLLTANCSERTLSQNYIVNG